MRSSSNYPSSNHKSSHQVVPTVPPGTAWPPTGRIDIDYGGRYPESPPDATVGKTAENGKAKRLSSRARPSQVRDPVRKGPVQKGSVQKGFVQKDNDVQEPRLPTDYWNDSLLSDDSDVLNNRASGNGRYSESASEDYAFEDERLEDDSLDGEYFDGEYVDGEYVDDDYFESESSGDNTYQAHALSGDDAFDAFDDDFSDDLAESLFSVFDGDRTGDSSHLHANGHRAKSETVKRRVSHQLGQRLLHIAATTPNSVEYFRQLVKFLDGAVSALSSSRSPSSRGPSSRESSDWSRQLQMVRSLIKRYGARGLEALDVLEDVIEIYPPAHLMDLSPVLIGLATRVVLKPRLQSSGKGGAIHPVLVRKLSAAVSEAVKLLAKNRQMKALPGLVASVGHISLRDHHPMNRLPQQLYQAATKVTQNPQLYQRLCALPVTQSVSHPSALSFARAGDGPEDGPGEAKAMPQRLRLNGPVEIFIRPLGEN